MKTFCPLPYRYAVIQMDPVAMVRHYDDPIALSAAAAMRPQTYLVYLEMALDISTPTKPWFRFEVSPVATTLRPEDKQRGITPDMVLPIHPNTRHLRGRTPVVTETPFPFPNCYHWIENYFVIRIRRKAIRYDDSTSVSVSIPDHLAIGEAFRADYNRMLAFQREQGAVATTLPSRDGLDNQPCHVRPTSPTEPPLPSDGAREDPGTSEDDVDSLPEGPDYFDDDDASPTTPATSFHGPRASESHNSILDLLNLGVFGFNVDHDAVELIPLVDLWNGTQLCGLYAMRANVHRQHAPRSWTVASASIMTT
ncbi:hypothetical protein C8Q78DRAFT_186147 [Trametes maxima]|nr:hypothetical protein C8Q78DRAFT_186147 [Trametes maxima]